jgi:hypothetical protein
MWWTWAIDKIAGLAMWLFRKKSASEQLAELQLAERRTEALIPTYMQQINFAFSVLAHEHPSANAMPLAAIAHALNVSPEVADEITQLLVKHNKLTPVRSPGPLGETAYVLVSESFRARASRPD